MTGLYDTLTAALLVRPRHPGEPPAHRAAASERWRRRRQAAAAGQSPGRSRSPHERDDVGAACYSPSFVKRSHRQITSGHRRTRPGTSRGLTA
ncbi:hypothetical protein DdX_21521 [Ditylenchus destructor]|uniref:Uncharacterized protein n=1 Tax=Ditylenchus destructor TaxID=166010 RepID=A0AAD4MEV7_9BILA|nr:hypothetical protein DdX_21521 [Ditylenchus destructor]